MFLAVNLISERRIGLHKGHSNIKITIFVLPRNIAFLSIFLCKVNIILGIQPYRYGRSKTAFISKIIFQACSHFVYGCRRCSIRWRCSIGIQKVAAGICKIKTVFCSPKRFISSFGICFRPFIQTYICKTFFTRALLPLINYFNRFCTISIVAVNLGIRVHYICISCIFIHE